MKNHLLTVFIFFTITAAFAQQSPVFAPEGKAIRGYDPVAYFTEQKPVAGNSSFVYKYQGADWYFATADNRDAFRANPEKYLPQYGGYCAYGTSRGYKAPTEADAWTIENGKLYLNYNQKVRTTWDQDRPGYIKKADANWKEIKDKKTN
jgi:YHS domain-containing protein